MKQRVKNLQVDMNRAQTVSYFDLLMLLDHHIITVNTASKHKITAFSKEKKADESVILPEQKMCNQCSKSYKKKLLQAYKTKTLPLTL